MGGLIRVFVQFKLKIKPLKIGELNS